MSPDTPLIASVTAIVTAFRRIDQTVKTIEALAACRPAPFEILVHVDGNEKQCAARLRQTFPWLRILESEENLGPGGGRNRLVAAANTELIASFDDDSYPLDTDFFQRAAVVFERYPEADLIACSIFHRGEPTITAQEILYKAPSFVGCGVVCKRDAFLEAGGYIPLPLAYGMEEEDLALRLLARGKTLFATPWLRVYHDTDLAHHANPATTSAQIANTALLVYLRYPLRLWPYGAAQTLNRVVWSFRHGRWRGILNGLRIIPGHIVAHRKFRSPVPMSVFQQRKRMRKSKKTELYRPMPADV